MPTILLTDDDVAVATELAAALRNRGYECVQVTSAAEAFDALAAHAVDLVILDLVEPDGDATVTRRLKDAVGAEQFLPVVVLTGADAVAQRVRAFRAGCDDFLAKPVDPQELEARLASLLARRAQHAELAAANAALRDAQRKKQELAALVVHDLRNPLSAIQGNLELVLEELESDGDFMREALSDCYKLAGRALFLVAGLLDVEEFEEGLLRAAIQEVELAPVLSQATPHHDATIEMRGLHLDLRVPEGLRARLDPDLTARLVENLLDNAVRYAPRGGNVVVAAELRDGELVVLVGNNGPPVPEAERERIFGRFYRLEARRAGARANRGLGLYFCQLAVEAHGGSIRVLETDELPACFELRIPQ